MKKTKINEKISQNVSEETPQEGFKLSSGSKKRESLAMKLVALVEGASHKTWNSLAAYQAKYKKMDNTHHLLPHPDIHAPNAPQLKPAVTDPDADLPKNKPSSNKAREQTWIEQHHIDYFNSLPKEDEKDPSGRIISRGRDSLLQRYSDAADAGDDRKADYWFARLFNSHAVALNYMRKAYAKEMHNQVMSTGDVAELSKEMVSGTNVDTKTRGYATRKANTIAGDMQTTSSEPEAHGNSGSQYHMVNMMNLGRDPEEIFMADDILAGIYGAIDAKWPGTPKMKMVLTYILVRSNTDRLVHFSLPGYEQVQSVIQSVIDQGRSPWTTYVFRNQIGISQRTWEDCLELIRSKAGPMSDVDMTWYNANDWEGREEKKKAKESRLDKLKVSQKELDSNTSRLFPVPPAEEKPEQHYSVTQADKDAAMQKYGHMIDWDKIAQRREEKLRKEENE